MNTTDTVLLIVLTTILSLFFLLGILLLTFAIKLIKDIRKVVIRAEEVVDSVESATEVLRDTRGNLAVLKLVRNIIKMMNK